MAKNKNGSKSSNAKNRKHARRVAQQKKATINKVVISIAVLAVLSFVGYQYATRPQPEPISEQRLLDNPSKGPSTAIVTLIEYADFGCPSCKAWHEAGIFEEMLADYDGLLRIEWRDLPIITQNSPKAAEAGQCAYDQDLFWEFHDVIFANAPRFSDTALTSYAQQAGLDMVSFTECFTSRKHRQTVQYDFAEATGLNLRGTPSFVVNGTTLVGPNPELVRQAIDLAIAAAQ